MQKSKKYADAHVALLSVDFSSKDVSKGFTDSSMMIYPIRHSWTHVHVSHAAYALSAAKTAAKENTLKLWGDFHTDLDVKYLYVKTEPFLPDLRSDRPLKERLFDWNPGKDALGILEPQIVFIGPTGSSIYNEDSVPTQFLISNSKFPELGVGVYDICWTWKYSPIKDAPDDEWIPFEETVHRIFITPDLPQFPWTPNIFYDLFMKDFSRTPMWTDALHQACSWAAGTFTPEDAAQKIADGLYSSGEFVYDGTSSYSEAAPPSHVEEKVKGGLPENTIYFFLSQVIDRLKGGEGKTNKINCVDCALIVASLSNLLGAKLQIANLQATQEIDDDPVNPINRFEIKNIKAIGMDSVESTMDYLKDPETGKSYFSYHCVAWLPGGEPTDFNNAKNIVYDGCVHFAKGENQKLVSAAGLNLGKENDPGYLTDLATKCKTDGINKCIPQNTTIRSIRIL